MTRSTRTDESVDETRLPLPVPTESPESLPETSDQKGSCPLTKAPDARGGSVFDPSACLRPDTRATTDRMFAVSTLLMIPMV
jgi:hypothetical protein